MATASNVWTKQASVPGHASGWRFLQRARRSEQGVSPRWEVWPIQWPGSELLSVPGPTRGQRTAKTRPELSISHNDVVHTGPNRPFIQAASVPQKTFLCHHGNHHLQSSTRNILRKTYLGVVSSGSQYSSLLWNFIVVSIPFFYLL